MCSRFSTASPHRTQIGSQARKVRPSASHLGAQGLSRVSLGTQCSFIPREPLTLAVPATNVWHPS
eukprot:1049464-Amphidinium_carterae.1